MSAVVWHPDEPQATEKVAVWTLTALFAGIEGFWWWNLILRPERPDREGGVTDETPSAAALSSWTELHAAMALRGGDQTVVARARRRGRRAMAEFLFWQALAVAGALAGGWLRAYDVEEVAGIETEPTLWAVMALGPVAILVIRMVMPGGIFNRAFASAQDELLSPLGLRYQRAPGIALVPRADGSPRPLVRGRATISGERYDRHVEARFERGGSELRIDARSPAFEVRSEAGKLVASPAAPPAAHGVVDELRRAKRWRGVKVSGGPDGIVVRRRGLRGEPWLYDLWLGERLAERLEAAGPQ
jgi:hypothetical protein